MARATEALNRKGRGRPGFNGDTAMRIPSLGKALVPSGSVKVTDKASGAVAYLFTNARGQACAIAFQRPGAKPAWCHCFPSARAREARISSSFQACGRAIAAKAARRAKRLRPHRLQPGHILPLHVGLRADQRELLPGHRPDRPQHGRTAGTLPGDRTRTSSSPPSDSRSEQDRVTTELVTFAVLQGSSDPHSGLP